LFSLPLSVFVCVKCYSTMILQENKWHYTVVHLNDTHSSCVYKKKAKKKKREAKKAVVLNCIIVLHQRHLSCKNRQSTWTSPFVDLRSRSLGMMLMSYSGIIHSFCSSDFRRRRFSVFIFGSREVTLQAIADNTSVRVRRHVGRWLSFSWCPGSTWGKNSFFFLVTCKRGCFGISVSLMFCPPVSKAKLFFIFLFVYRWNLYTLTKRVFRSRCSCRRLRGKSGE